MRWCVSEDKIKNHEITRDGHEKKFLICDAEKFVFLLYIKYIISLVKLSFLKVGLFCGYRSNRAHSPVDPQGRVDGNLKALTTRDGKEKLVDIVYNRT